MQPTAQAVGSLQRLDDAKAGRPKQRFWRKSVVKRGSPKTWLALIQAR
jgi:hypothetical protein